MAPEIVAIAGGVGGAKLALGLSRVFSPSALTVVVNTADDDTFHGLHVSPDLDTVMYTLAGLANPETGWGLAGDTFRTMDALKRVGAQGTWFNLGDLDLATHLRRTELLRAGQPLSNVTRELARRLGVKHPIVPMTDDEVRTVVETDRGPLPFQEYFVRYLCEPRVSSIEYRGADAACPAPAFVEALRDARTLVFCPSNPILSIGPVLAISGVRDSIAHFRGLRIAVSPIVGGAAIRGPAAKIMLELGEDVSCVGVARRLHGLCDVMVIDNTDAGYAPAIADLGIRPVVTNTIMHTEEQKVELAETIVELTEIRYGDE